LKLKEETLDIERHCDTEYHIAYTQLMQKGIMPKATLEKRMKAQEIWTDQDDEKLQSLQGELVKYQIQLEKSTTFDEGIEIAKMMGDLRAQCLRLVEVKAAVLSNSCESLADQIRRDAYLAYATTYADTGKPVFKSYNDFMQRASDQEEVVLDARRAMLNIATESFNHSLTSLPEVEYIKNVETKIHAEAMVTAKEEANKEEKKE
jgi:hypothetical protein